MPLIFEWDKHKAASNAANHGVSFDEAKTVFDDALAYTFDDDEHSEQEQREIIIGHSDRNRLIVVSFTERSTDVIRIISARRATNMERRDYEDNA